MREALRFLRKLGPARMTSSRYIYAKVQTNYEVTAMHIIGYMQLNVELWHYFSSYVRLLRDWANFL